MIFIPKPTFDNLIPEKKERILNASINEFSKRNYHDAKLSNIIRESKIPRGSFYQYFKDKMDLYQYLFAKIADKKIAYLSDLLSNKNNLPFLDLFRELYITGAIFAYENPKYVSIMSLLISTKDNIYDIMIADSIKMAQKYYIDFIDKDKEMGRIDPLIDSKVLANLVIQMTLNVTLDEINEDGLSLNMDLIISKIDQIIYIFKKGILIGEKNV